MKRRDFLKGMAGTTGLVLANEMAASTLLFQNQGMINQALNVTTSRVVQTDGDTTDTTYYGADVLKQYGEDISSKANALKVEMAAAAESVAQAEEGTVVLINQNGFLPLAADSTKVTVFGNGSTNSRYNKSKSTSTVDAIPMVTFNDAMTQTFGASNVNLTLSSNVYSKLSTTDSSNVYEAPISDVKAQESSWKSTGSVAVVVLTRYGTEDAESAMLVDDNGTTRHYMGLMQNEMDLMSYLQAGKKSGMFKGVVAVINADQMMELGWAYDYDVDALVIAGIPGTQGFEGVANVLSGKVNASGKLADSYPANSLSAPACTYAAAENSQQWANLSEVMNYIDAEGVVAENHADDYVIYAEGIYVGYKYYETRYEDCVMGRYGADDTVGSTSGGAWNYAEEMDFTFGAGLSYTTFEQKLKGVRYDSAEDLYTVTVEVTNTGSIAGKSVVEVYAQTPYGEYEVNNGVEKSAIQLAGFEKTEDIAPGASVTVEVPIERYLLASYDSNNARGYILSAGTCYFAIGEDAHDALNNVLAAKGYSSADGMVDARGNAVDGDASKTYTWTETALDSSSYHYSRYAENAEVTNQFDQDQLSSYGVDFTYLTRSDWAGTFPAKPVGITASEDMMKDLRGDWYDDYVSGLADVPSTAEYTQGMDNGMSFITLKDAAWEDEEIWDTFIDQLTVDEMLSLRNDSNGCGAIEHVALPSQARGDDGVCIQQGSLVATGQSCLSWVSEVMTSRTWNKKRFAARGHMLGVEAIYCNLNDLWYGGGNIHRTAFGGRNMQYYSEDGILGYYVGWYEAQAMQALGIMYGIKHFALNDQEANRESLGLFANEQSIREIYLRSFEGPMCKGGAMDIMTGFNRIGVRYVATNPSLLTGVLKTEWGYKGHVTTDAGSNSYKSRLLEQLVAGIDYTCWNNDNSIIGTYINNGDGYALKLLRLATKHNLYAASRSVSVNGLSSSTRVEKIVPAWQKALAYGGVGLAVAGAALAGGAIAADVKAEPAPTGKAEKPNRLRLTAAVLSAVSLAAFTVYGLVFNYFDTFVFGGLALAAVLYAFAGLSKGKLADAALPAGVLSVAAAEALFFVNSFPVWADEVNGITMYNSRGGLVPVIGLLVLLLASAITGIAASFKASKEGK